MKLETSHARAAVSMLWKNPVWAAYALADLDPRREDECEFWLEDDCMLLVYRGIRPPHLFAYGDPSGIEHLINSLPSSEYQYAFLPIHLSILKDRFQISTHLRMWRMHLVDPGLLISEGMKVEQLGIQTLDEIESLYGDNIDRPDAFSEAQVEEGHFFGIKTGDAFVAVAGTHVVSEVHKVAAIGNVFTHPDYRNLGYAKKSSSAVCTSLLKRGIEIIVLNVGMENLPALSVYKSIGFMPYCGYYEGIANFAGPN